MKDDHQYDALRNTDSHSVSSTEVEEEEWDTEKSVKPRRRRTKGVWTRIKRWRWVVNTILLLVILGLLVEKRWEGHKAHRYEFTGDVTGFAPQFSQQTVMFMPDPVFAPENASAFWDKETQRAWLDIVPKGLGYVRISEPSKYDNLPHPIHDYPNTTVFTTSMTHQLHCLWTILDAYNTLITTSDPSRISMPFHINHCFDYIRQAIMCAGDVALEGAATTFPPDPVTGEDRGGSDGWDAKHVCKDYGEVIGYLEKETIGKVKWIGSDS